MGIPWVSFVFGILLIFIAIVGGGFEVREVKVPQVGRVARAVSAAVGLFFLAIGGNGLAADPPKPPEAHAQVTPQSSAPQIPTPAVEFTVHDELGDLQITEQVMVYIDGKAIGTLTVDTVHTRSHLTASVPKPGRYPYRLESTTTFDLDGGPTEVVGHGEGQVDVTAGRSFSVAYELGDTALILRLQ